MSVGSLARSAGAATFSQVWRMAVALGTNMVLRRLLAPEDFGLWHWTEPLTLLLGQVRDLGLPGHLMRLRERRPWRTLLVLETVWGAILAAVVVAAAPLLARLYEDPDLVVVPVLAVLALFLLFEGLAKVPLTYFESELAIGRSIGAELLRNGVFAAGSIGLALLGHGVWSLVVAHVAATGLYAAVLWWRALGHGMRLGGGRAFDIALVRKGFPLALMALLWLLQDKLAFFVLGFRFSGHDLGLYGPPLFLSFLVAVAVALPVSRALYPALVAFQDDRRLFFDGYRLGTLLIVAFEVPWALVLLFNSELLVVLYAGEQYREAAPLLRILALAPLVQPLSRCAGDVLLTLHRDRLMIVSSLLTLASLAGIGYWASLGFGLEGMAWAHLLPLGAPVIAWAIYRVDPPGFWRLLRELAVLYALPLPLFLAAVAVTDAPWPRLVLTLLAAALAFGLYLWRFGAQFRRFFRGAGVGSPAGVA